jgi:hypothetical protein
MIHVGTRGIACLALIAAAGLASCGTTPDRPRAGAAATAYAPPTSVAVFASPEVRAFDRTPRGGLPHERFEFGRNDARLSPTAPAALRAVDQWPQPARPVERPFRLGRYIRW